MSPLPVDEGPSLSGVTATLSGQDAELSEVARAALLRSFAERLELLDMVEDGLAEEAPVEDMVSGASWLFESQSTPPRPRDGGAA